MSDDTFPTPGPDRMPTPDEEKAAERAADDVDVDAVADHFEDMMDKGAHVRGEGQIDPRD
jgi:hypothetical protein